VGGEPDLARLAQQFKIQTKLRTESCEIKLQSPNTRQGFNYFLTDMFMLLTDTGKVSMILEHGLLRQNFVVFRKQRSRASVFSLK